MLSSRFLTDLINNCRRVYSDTENWIQQLFKGAMLFATKKMLLGRRISLFFRSYATLLRCLPSFSSTTDDAARSSCNKQITKSIISSKQSQIIQCFSVLNSFAGFNSFTLGVQASHFTIREVNHPPRAPQRHLRLILACTPSKCFLLYHKPRSSYARKSTTFLAVSVPMRTTHVAVRRRDVPPQRPSPNSFSESGVPLEGNRMDFYLQLISMNRQNYQYVANRLDDMTSFMQRDFKQGLRFCDHEFLVPLLYIIKYTPDVRAVQAFIHLCVMFHEIDGRTGAKKTPKIMAAYFVVDLWQELNIWFRQGVKNENAYIMMTLCKLYQLLSKYREVRLQKLPKVVLDFLKDRTRTVLDGLTKFSLPKALSPSSSSGSECSSPCSSDCSPRAITISQLSSSFRDVLPFTEPFLYHLVLMMSVHSECRYVFRSCDGISIIVAVLKDNNEDFYISKHCITILNIVVEGVLKRNFKLFKRRESGYSQVVQCLHRFFTHSKELTTLICSFITKVLRLCPEDSYYLTQSRAQDRIQDVRNYYENDIEINQMTNKVLAMMKTVPREFNMKRPKSRSRSRSKSRTEDNSTR